MNVVSNAAASFSWAESASSPGFGTRSILFSTRSFGCRNGASRSRMARASSSRPRWASISTQTRSASWATPQALVTIDRDASGEAAGRLRLVGDDRHLRADERVDERRLAGIGRAEDRDEAAAGRRLVVGDAGPAQVIEIPRTSHQADDPRRAPERAALELCLAQPDAANLIGVASCSNRRDRSQ